MRVPPETFPDSTNLYATEHKGDVWLFNINPRPTKPFFVTWFTKGVVTTPL